MKLKHLIKEILIMENTNYSKVLKTLGISVGDIPQDGKSHELKTVNIPPDSLGLFAPAITKMTLRVTAGFIENSAKYVVVLNYSYQHPSGSNGYEVKLVSLNRGKTWSIQ